MIKFISWLGTMASIVGAFLVASQIVFIGYLAFIIGSASWLFVGFKRKDNSLIVLNGVFFLENILGIYNAYQYAGSYLFGNDPVACCYLFGEFKMIFKIVITVFFPIIALLDWTISNYPLSDFIRQNMKHYRELMQ